jgi:hypothetical protein
MANPFHGVHPAELCDKHLVSAHGEIHMVVESLRQGTNLGDLANYVDPERLQERHDELEDYAGYNSPLPEFPTEQNGNVDVQHVRERLARRCPDCADKMHHLANAEDLSHLASD